MNASPAHSSPWPPQVARAMHELANAAPAAPTVDRLEQVRSTGATPQRQSRGPSWSRGIAVAATVTAALVLLIILVVTRNSATTPPVSPSPATVSVVRTRARVTIEAAITCDHPIDSTGTFATFTVDTYADRAGRRWRTTITYPDGTTHDNLALGSAFYPDRAYTHGEMRNLRGGCESPDMQSLIVSMDPTQGYAFALDPAPELDQDERTYIEDYHLIAERQDRPQPDEAGRSGVLWEQRMEGLVGFGRVVNTPLTQVRTWWVDPVDGATVTQYRAESSAPGLGSVTVTATLTASDTLTATGDLFDTTGYTEIPTLKRPAVPPAPRGVTFESSAAKAGPATTLG